MLARAARTKTGLGSDGSKCLSNRKEVLKMAYILLDAAAVRAGARIYARVDQILLRSLISEEGRRIDAIPQIHPQGPHRRAVANAKTYRMHHVIEILKVLLPDPKRQIAQAGVGVACVMKGHAAHVLSDQRKAEFRLVEQQRRAAQRKPCGDVARSRLVFRESAVRSAPAAKEPLRQRHRAQRIARKIERINLADFGAAGQHQLLANRMVCG